MRILSLIAVCQALVFLEEPQAENIKKNLESIGYEVLDTAGHVKDAVIESWDPESLRSWVENHGLTVPKSSDELLSVATKNKDLLLQDIKDYAAAGHESSKAILNKGKEFYETTAGTLGEFWSESRLKEFLDARGIQLPQAPSREELLKKISQFKESLPSVPAGKFWFDSWSKEELAETLGNLGKDIEGTRKQLAERLWLSYHEGLKEGEEKGRDLARSFGKWRDAHSFDKWSVDDLKDFVTEFGGHVQGTKDELVTAARESYNEFVYGSKKEPLKHRLSRQATDASNIIKDSFKKLLSLNVLFREEL